MDKFKRIIKYVVAAIGWLWALIQWLQTHPFPFIK